MKLKKITLLSFVLLIVCGLALIVGCSSPATEDEGVQEGVVENDDSSATEGIVWTADMDCSPCHGTEATSQTDSAYLASKHGSLTCATCHTDTAALEKAHESANAGAADRAALKATEVPEEVCLTCHDKDEIAEKTKDSTVLTDANGLVVNPHAVPGIADHETLDCNSCHQMHVEDADLDKKANRACGSCHHANVYECYTCHS